MDQPPKIGWSIVMKKRYRLAGEPEYHNGKRVRLKHPEGFKDRLAGEQNWRCCYCGRRLNTGEPGALASLEHVVPFSLGGADHYDNLVITCEPCNFHPHTRPR